MSAAIDLGVFAETVMAIAEEVFTAMVDGEPGVLQQAFEPVDAAGRRHVRVGRRARRAARSGAARHRARDGHAAHPGAARHDRPEEVSDADYVDAVGEIANVVGGNVKALVPDPGPLTLPQVATARPAATRRCCSTRPFAWRGRPLAISLWSLP